ncbi:hypothetical protein [Mesorhizobium sp. WSM2239]|uniref:HTH merR-type domain-containing protein n=2 Tax=unclassified Mesorhizobium TaxID=325217 RepID=A0AAU8D4E6_9HYPH
MTKRVRTYTFAGKTLTLPQWADEVGIKAATLRDRIGEWKWPLERALTEPVMTADQRTVYNHNRRIIRRITAFVRTGGYEATFHTPSGTGAGSVPGDLQSDSRGNAP